ncbi:argininosuccinate lyase, partial [Staphylococcus sp. KY49P]|nr:argininosuccinate lyase [Staphylococcus sp. KY49P]
MSSKAWGGRFSEQPEAWVDEFNASIHFDKTLIKYDVQGSIAHATMLAKQDIISDSDCEQIIEGLNAILADYEQGNLALDVSLEDIHLNIEHELIKRIGDAG